ncbi:MAG: hypothetical protein V7K90_13220 [Nostoc sp.]|uniref:hypothetical protein n=1 Tax=Nostoc sp. TaxID=1180 RepID=UPI002FF7710B
MCAKGFGQSQPTKIDKLIQSAVRYCHKRHPEALDSIFGAIRSVKLKCYRLIFPSVIAENALIDLYLPR